MLDLSACKTKEDSELYLWLALQLLQTEYAAELIKCLKLYKNSVKPDPEKLQELMDFGNLLIENYDQPDLLFQLADWLVVSLPEPGKAEDCITLAIRRSDFSFEQFERIEKFKQLCLQLA